MPCCTYLSEGECCKPTSDDELNSLLSEVRAVTGEDWRIRESLYPSHRWFRRSTVIKRYTLFHGIGCTEFQIINFYRPDLKDWSINTNNEAGYVAAYLYGVLSAVRERPAGETENKGAVPGTSLEERIDKNNLEHGPTRRKSTQSEDAAWAEVERLQDRLKTEEGRTVYFSNVVREYHRAVHRFWLGKNIPGRYRQGELLGLLIDYAEGIWTPPPENNLEHGPQAVAAGMRTTSALGEGADSNNWEAELKHLPYPCTSEAVKDFIRAVVLPGAESEQRKLVVYYEGQLNLLRGGLDKLMGDNERLRATIASLTAEAEAGKRDHEAMNVLRAGIVTQLVSWPFTHGLSWFCGGGYHRDPADAVLAERDRLNKEGKST